MSEISRRDRIAGAILGTLIGDALGVGPHWYYDQEKLKEDYGSWIDDYKAPLPHRFHSGLKAGESSQTGQVVTMLLESVSSAGDYDEKDFTGKMDGFLARLDGSPQGGRYTDQAMRDVWRARNEGVPWSRAGSFSDTAEAAIRTPVLAARYIGDFKKAAESIIDNIRLTHRDPFISGQSAAFGLIVHALIRGETLPEVAGAVSRWAKKDDVSLEIPLAQEFRGKDGTIFTQASFFDSVLQPSWSREAARDERISIMPAHAVCRLFGLACTLGFLLPAAYYFASRYENDFEMAVLSAINGGGNNMARAALTGALSGAIVGFKAIPERFISGLTDNDRLIKMANKIADAALAS